MEFNMNFLNYQIQSWARVIIFSRGGVMFGVVWGAKGDTPTTVFRNSRNFFAASPYTNHVLTKSQQPVTLHNFAFASLSR